jgi:phage terminase large subunit-like protein
VVTATFAPPRVHLVPHAVASRADDVFEMARLVSFELDPWQELVVEGACGEGHDGKWKAKEVGVNVPRQNGKGGILELIELTALYVWLPRLPTSGRSGERLLIHSAHEFITSQKHFDRLWSLVETTPELLEQVVRGRPIRTHGQEGFKLQNGAKIEFRSRTAGGGRGFSCDFLVLDEAMFLPERAMGALLPTLRARPDPQIWYTGSAVDQEVHTEGFVFTRVRERALKGDDSRLAYFEWSLPYEHPSEMPEKEFVDEEAMWRSNPAFGIRIFKEHFEMEVAALDRRTSAVELFGVGDYPDPSGSDAGPISVEQWLACEDEDSKIVGPVCFAFDVSPERRTSIAAAGKNQGGKWHVEVIEKLAGTGWLPSRLADLVEQHEPQLVICDKIGPGASVLSKLEDAGLTVTLADSAEHAQACGRFMDAVVEGQLRHLGSVDLMNSIRAAKTRPNNDRWLWSRRNSTMDISPLVASTLALWAAMGQPDDADEVVIYW